MILVDNNNSVFMIRQYGSVVSLQVKCDKYKHIDILHAFQNFYFKELVIYKIQCKYVHLSISTISHSLYSHTGFCKTNKISPNVTCSLMNE